MCRSRKYEHLPLGGLAENYNRDGAFKIKKKELYVPELDWG